MGTQEYLLDKAERKGIQKGKIEGKIEMLRELGFTIVEICQKLGLFGQAWSGEVFQRSIETVIK